jgi:hypothetical protein
MASEEGQRVITNTTAEYPMRKGMVRTAASSHSSELQPPKVTPPTWATPKKRWTSNVTLACSDARNPPNLRALPPETQKAVDLAAAARPATGGLEPAAVAVCRHQGLAGRVGEAVHPVVAAVCVRPDAQHLWLMVGVTVTCALVGLSLAWLLERSNLPGRRLWGVILCLPFAVPAFVSSFTWVSLSASLKAWAAPSW